jgi:hypothetical protein
MENSERHQKENNNKLIITQAGKGKTCRNTGTRM